MVSIITTDPIGDRKYTLPYAIFLLTITFILGMSFVVPESMLDQFNSGPSVFFCAVTSLNALGGAFFILLKRNFRFDLNMLDAVILTATSWVLVDRIFSNYTVYFSFDIVKLICLTFLYISCKHIIIIIYTHTSFRFHNHFYIIILSSTFISCLLGLVQLLGLASSNNGYFRMTGQFNNPAVLANYLIALMPINLMLYMRLIRTAIKREILRYISLFMLLFGSTIILFSFCRSAWIALLVAAIIASNTKNAWIKNISIKNLIAIIGLLFALFVFVLYLKPNSALGRITIWKVSGSIICQNPLTGIGYGNFESQYHKYQADYFSSSNRNSREINLSGLVKYPFNEFLRIIIEFGIIGIILFIWFIDRLFSLLALKTYSLHQIQLKDCCLLGVFSILCSGFFSYPLSILSILSIFYLYLGILSGIQSTSQRSTCRLNSKYFAHVYALFLFISSVILICYSIYKAQLYVEWKRSFTSKKMATLLPSLVDDGSFITDYSNILMNEKKYKVANKLLENYRYLFYTPDFYNNLGITYQEIGNIDKAEEAFNVADKMIPNRIFSKYLLAKLYFETEQYQKSFEMCSLILSIGAKRPSYHADIILDDVKNMKNLLIEHL